LLLGWVVVSSILSLLSAVISVRGARRLPRGSKVPMHWNPGRYDSFVSTPAAAVAFPLITVFIGTVFGLLLVFVRAGGLRELASRSTSTGGHGTWSIALPGLATMLLSIVVQPQFFRNARLPVQRESRPRQSGSVDSQGLQSPDQVDRRKVAADPVLGSFISNRCELGPDLFEHEMAFLSAYEAWERHLPDDEDDLLERLAALGFGLDSRSEDFFDDLRSGGRVIHGLRLRSSPEPASEPRTNT